MQSKTYAKELSHSAEENPRRWWILGVLCLSLVLVVSGNTAMNVAMPTLVREIGASQTELQWIVDAYSLVFAGLLLPAGALGDRYGRKQALQLGLIIFGIACVGASLGSSPEHIIMARATMGIGAAFIMPATLSLLSVAFPPHERGQAIAIWSGFAGAGGALGPIVSGIVLEHLSWSYVFLVNVPIVLFALLIGAWLIPSSREEKVPRFDALGAFLSIVGVTGLLYGIIEGPERGWTDPMTIAGFVVGTIFLAIFILWELRTNEPMIDLHWFRIRSFSTGVTAIMLAFLSFMSVLFLITQFFQFVLGYTPFVAGIAQLPEPLVVLLLAPQSARLVKRYGARRVLATGLFLISVSLGLMALVASLETNYLFIALSLSILGVAIAFSTAPSTTLVLTSLPMGKAGVGSAINDITRELGVAVGVAILGSILTSGYQNGLNALEFSANIIEQAKDSIGAALQLAQDMNSEVLNIAARQAFTNGFQAALIVGAIITLIASLIILRYGPTKTELSATNSARH